MIQGAAFRILYLFVDTDTLGFAEICKKASYGTDLGGYYLRSLVHDGLLKKVDRGQYTITPTGKHELAITNNGRHTFVLRPRVTILLVAHMNDNYAVLERTIQPFIGKHEWPAASILHGESMATAAARTLRLRLGLEGEPDFIGFYRRIDLIGEDVFDDKLFAVHTFTVPEDMVVAGQGETGKIIFTTTAELQDIAHPAKSLLDIFNYAQAKQRAPYAEHIYTLSEEDLSSSES